MVSHDIHDLYHQSTGAWLRGSCEAASWAPRSAQSALASDAGSHSVTWDGNCALCRHGAHQHCL